LNYFLESEAGPVQNCPPKILAFNARSGKLIETLGFENLVQKSSRLQYLILDYDRSGNKYLYISDASERAIIVYDVAGKQGYRVILPKT
jgi:hypothetical protein